MIKLPFKPEFFPILLLPLYWLYFLCFYLWYIPFYFVVWLFSPYRSSETLYKDYLKKHSKDKRSMRYENHDEEKEGIE
jgi:hypothetical protein